PSGGPLRNGRSDGSSRHRLGWNGFFEEQARLLEAGGEPAARLFARVTEEQRGAYRVAGDFDGWAEVSGRFRHNAVNAADFPAVGDWVVVEAEVRASGPPDGRGIVHQRLGRQSAISRSAAGRAVDEQVI